MPELVGYALKNVSVTVNLAYNSLLIVNDMVDKLFRCFERDWEDSSSFVSVPLVYGSFSSTLVCREPIKFTCHPPWLCVDLPTNVLQSTNFFVEDASTASTKIKLLEIWDVDLRLGKAAKLIGEIGSSVQGRAKLTKETKLTIANSMVLPTLACSCEAWALQIRRGNWGYADENVKTDRDSEGGKAEIG